ncbi:MAG: transcriptional regulator [Synergistaceae bacterium]|nr:transcriptional regulator [Synergistaceae bacterium]
MTLNDIVAILDSKVLCGGEKLDSVSVPYAYASDLMSDVIAFCYPGALLITGLAGFETLETAQLMEIPAVLFVNGKQPPDMTISQAVESDIPLLLTAKSMFYTVGLLYEAGIKPCL